MTISEEKISKDWNRQCHDHAPDEPTRAEIEDGQNDATAELDAIPGLRDKVWERYNRLVETGKITPKMNISCHGAKDAKTLLCKGATARETRFGDRSPNKRKTLAGLQRE